MHMYVRNTYLAEYFNKSWKFAKISKKISIFMIFIRGPPHFESFRNARQAVVWLRLQVDFKYHEITKFFCKNAPPGIDPAISREGGERINH